MSEDLKVKLILTVMVVTIAIALLLAARTDLR